MTRYPSLVSSKKKPNWLRRSGIIVAALAATYVLLMAFLPAPKPTVALTYKSSTLDTGKTIDMPWPDTGEAAIGAAGQGVLQTNNANKPTPMASTAKLVLALAVLQKKPMAVGDTGATITITAEDVAIYQKDLAENGSVVPVNQGEQLTEYQALQALLLPSGNNIATTLANWAFGSETDYLSYATTMLGTMHLTHTHLADASGFSAKTVSTPSDLVQIGITTLQDKTLAGIVAQKSATLPVVGEIANVNADLGQRDINGIKTGNTDEAGGCLVFSATRTVGNKSLTVVGAVQALPGLQGALDAAPDLVDNAFMAFVPVAGVPSDAAVGTMTAAWAPAVNIMATKDISQLIWSGTPLSRTVTVTPGFDGNVGTASVGKQNTPLKLASAIPQPSLWWRLTHPLQLLKAALGT